MTEPSPLLSRLLLTTCELKLTTRIRVGILVLRPSAA